MSALLAIVRKDLLLFRTDRRAVLMQIAAPVLISAFFGFVFARSSSDAPSAKIVLLAVDQDGSATSKGIIAGLGSEAMLAVKPAAADAAPDQVRRGDASVAIVFPSNFEPTRAARCSVARASLRLASSTIPPTPRSWRSCAACSPSTP